MKIKNFREWHHKKRTLHNKKARPFFHRREVWFCSLGENIGFEQDGGGKQFLRPVIVIKKFNNQVFWALPLTKTAKTGKYYYKLQVSNRKEKSTVILSQFRLVDAKRLQYKIGDLTEKDFLETKKRIISLLQ